MNDSRDRALEARVTYSKIATNVIDALDPLEDQARALEALADRIPSFMGDDARRAAREAHESLGKVARELAGQRHNLIR